MDSIGNGPEEGKSLLYYVIWKKTHVASQVKVRNLDWIGCRKVFKQKSDIWKDHSRSYMKKDLNKKKRVRGSKRREKEIETI
jgi:hypothetical protein